MNRSQASPTSFFAGRHNNPVSGFAPGGRLRRAGIPTFQRAMLAAEAGTVRRCFHHEAQPCALTPPPRDRHHSVFS
ncbi:hypothetical protein CBM2615_B10226 [Cupriavidus taiwanensis]|uniref:Uncharacterized protein n=1 Tax=Cupriavidus taiwanensis TaxID=164546 RepID=A0A976AZU3_9BURK|nr:hypothetical protein CBM2615_B10226 [Cupriavidus taiwanensis]SOZ62296.1 hypothetical protein CBM2614_B10133 [Cupriavidus taiwanensis]SOZ66331.1 hypothetical protein CBM2613_B10226 [Cupriavidus taiwanensis]SPA07530.1 hypothetical protein CBM2625_B10225 [Cupriavidus taiwanensis]